MLICFCCPFIYIPVHSAHDQTMKLEVSSLKTEVIIFINIKFYQLYKIGKMLEKENIGQILLITLTSQKVQQNNSYSHNFHLNYRYS